MCKKQLHSGKVIKLDLDEFNKIERAIVETEKGKKYILPRSEINVSLLSKLKEGYSLYFVILHDNVISIKKTLCLRREKVLESLNSSEGASGNITAIYSWGAHVSIYGYTCSLLNSEFSIDNTTVGSIHKEGDLLTKLKLVKITSSKNIYVSPIKKYKSSINLDSRFIKKGTKVLGIVKNIKKFQNQDKLVCFVGIPGELNLLARMPAFSLKEDDKVVCEVKKIDESSGILRGRILEVKQN